MHFLLLLAHFISCPNPADSSGFYGIKFYNINGTYLNTNAYKGKKVVVALLSADSSSLGTVRYLDSVQRVKTDLQIFIVPTDEFGVSITVADLVTLQKTLKLTITQPLKVKKANGAYQHPFFIWLTSDTMNRHFNIDADESGKAFIISAQGTLYSVCGKQTPKAVFGAIINQNFTE